MLRKQKMQKKFQERFRNYIYALRYRGARLATYSTSLGQAPRARVRDRNILQIVFKISKIFETRRSYSALIYICGVVWGGVARKVSGAQEISFWPSLGLVDNGKN